MRDTVTFLTAVPFLSTVKVSVFSTSDSTMRNSVGSTVMTTTEFQEMTIILYYYDLEVVSLGRLI